MIKVNGLLKKYGKRIALNDFSFEIKRGKVIGILGPNGSGKTTLLEIMSGVLDFEKGEIKINEKDLGVYTKSIVSFLPSDNQFFIWMKVKDAVNFYENFYSDFNKRKAFDLLDNLKIDINKRINTFSKGYSQIIRLILTISRDAKVYIMDEPFEGIDIINKDKLYEILNENFEENKTYIISTHQINDIEKLIDYVVFIKNGKNVLENDCDDLRLEYGKSLENISREVFENF
jgi:ABC-2 type transport system ATP-binding protein